MMLLLVIPLILFLLAFYALPLIFDWQIRDSRRWLGVVSVLLLSWPGYLLFRFTRSLPPTG